MRCAILPSSKSDRIKEKQITKKTGNLRSIEAFHAKQANTYKSHSKWSKLINLSCLRLLSVVRVVNERAD